MAIYKRCGAAACVTLVASCIGTSEMKIIITALVISLLGVASAGFLKGWSSPSYRRVVYVSPSYSKGWPSYGGGWSGYSGGWPSYSSYGGGYGGYGGYSSYGSGWDNGWSGSSGWW